MLRFKGILGANVYTDVVSLIQEHVRKNAEQLLPNITHTFMLGLLGTFSPIVYAVNSDDANTISVSLVFDERSRYKLRMVFRLPKAVIDLYKQFYSDKSASILDKSTTRKEIDKYVSEAATQEFLLLLSLAKGLYRWKPMIVGYAERKTQSRTDDYTTVFFSEALNALLLSLVDFYKTSIPITQILYADNIGERIAIENITHLAYIQRIALFGSLERMIRDMYLVGLLEDVIGQSQLAQTNSFSNLQSIIATLDLKKEIDEKTYIEYAKIAVDRLLEHIDTVLGEQFGSNQGQDTGQATQGKQQGQQQQSQQTDTQQGQQQTPQTGDVIMDTLMRYMQNPEIVYVQMQGAQQTTNSTKDIATQLALQIQLIEDYIHEKFRGVGSATLREIIGEPQKFDLSWLNKLKTIVIDSILTDRRRKQPIFTKPNKILYSYTQETGIVLPELVDRDKQHHIILTIDESGSMSNEELRYINYLLQEASKYAHIYLIKHDYDIVFEKEIKPTKKPKAEILELVKTRHAAGGTSHAEVFKRIAQYVEKRKIMNSPNSRLVIIIASDFYSDLETVMPEYKDIILDRRAHIVCLTYTEHEQEQAKKVVRTAFGQVPQNFSFITIQKENTKVA